MGPADFPAFCPLHVGSLPFTDPREAVRFVFEQFPEIPAWPQLPRRSPSEGICAQMKDAAAWVDPARSLPADDEAFAIGAEEASGLHAFLSEFGNFDAGRTVAVKGQWVGPLTYSLHARDEGGEPLLAVPSALSRVFEIFERKVRWQIGRLKRLFPRVVFFVDEPDLSESGVLAVMGGDEALESLQRVSRVIRDAGALPGIHACGTPSWKHLFGSGFEIASFEVGRFPEETAPFERELVQFHEGGGVFAFGLVPSDRPTETPTLAHLQQMFDALLSRWALLGIGGKRLTERCLISPACGLASHTVEQAAERVALLRKLAHLLRQTYTTQVKFSL